MGKYVDGVTQFFQGIADQAGAEADPHRKAILQNYLVHAALEYTDRWMEIFRPERTVDHPVYKVRWGSPDEVVFDGAEAVHGFYRSLKDDTFLTNDSQLLAVGDWGFASFLNINLFMSAAKARAGGFEVDDENAQYALITPCGMYWTYNEQAQLIGEYVYEIGAGKLVKVDPEDEISFEDVQAVVAPYLPALAAAA